MSLLDANQCISGAYDDDSSALKVLPSAFINASYDYIAVAYPTSSTETYTYKTGGASGTTVATVTVTYTDSTKQNLSSIAKV